MIRFDFVGGSQEKSKYAKAYLLFSLLSLIGLNCLDIVIAQLVALSNVCKANLPLSEAKQCRMVQAQQGEPYWGNNFAP